MRPAAFYSLRLLAGRAPALLASVILGCNATASAQPLNPSTAKIQFMHYVAQYAVWPKDVLLPESKQFVLGVLGENPFGESLENYFRGKSVKNRTFVVKFCKDLEDAKSCQMLFINSSEKGNLGQMLEQLADSSVLTISDSAGFLQKNGMIYMYITPKSEITGGLGWDINKETMKRARLQIDPFFIDRARQPPN